ncbi:OmpP1/FadL family transporter [Ferrimonas balearica]|uniref:OmpP1/FadL family transporter n=1 Tax=Ferrimonas balearica TaxID=44012 RepID=UPI001C58A647|nr:outer membrane protein transport protein [Ferrimonas balearica]MBW3165190.1 OmpP1/FadL family transporter [Ferrimonas balearica]
MKTMNKTLLATAIALASTQSLAAGFQLNSQSATGIGRAFAGDAVIADNASVLARNPAAMALFDAPVFSGGLTYADVSVDIKDVNFAGGLVDLGGIDDAGSGKVIPNIFYIHPLNDKVAVGFGAFSNFGTGTDSASLIKADTKVAPFDLIGNTEVTTVNFNASVSYRINDQLSLGAGLDVIYGEGSLDRYAGATPLVDVEADGIGFGGIVGATYEINENHRFGLSYRFSPDMGVEGDINTVTPQNIPGIGIANVATNFNELEVPLADIFQFAGFHQLTNQFAMHYTAQWTQWSNFHQITAKDGTGMIVGNPDAPAIPVGDVALKEYKWKDSWFLSLGGTYTVNDKWTLRAGYAYDQGVVDEISSISIPDSDRQWFTAGVGFNLTPKSTIDFGFAYIMGEEVDLIENSAIVGPVNATTESGAMYYSLQYSHQF